MKRKLMLVALWLSVRGVMTEPVFAQQVSQLIQESKTDRMSLAPGAVIHIDGSFGDLNIEGWNQQDVEITVIKTLPYDYKQSKAAKDMSAVKVTTEKKSDKELDISTTVATHDNWFLPITKSGTDMLIEYQIHAPRDSKLVIHHGDGSVIVNNMAADIDADSNKGDLIVMLPDPASRLVDARTRFGIIASDFGETHRARFIGETLLNGKRSSSPLVHLRMGRGGITLKTQPAEAYTAEQ